MTRVLITSFGFGHLEQEGLTADSLGAHVVVDLRVHFRDPHVSPEIRDGQARPATDPYTTAIYDPRSEWSAGPAL